MFVINCYLAFVCVSLISLAVSTSAFVTSNNSFIHLKSPKRGHQQLNLKIDSASHDSLLLGRRDIIKKAGSLLIFSQVLSSLNVQAAQAKDKEPISLSVVKDSFQAVRDELNSGGVPSLAVLVENEDYDQIMEFTKGYDLEFRKAKMGKARKFLTSKEDKEKAVLLCNAVTFDLIGMNKGSRVGQRDIVQVKKYYTELIADIQAFLELEKYIDESEYVSL